MAEDALNELETLSHGRKKIASVILVVFVLGLMAASVLSSFSSEGVGRYGSATERYLRIIHEKGNSLEAAKQSLADLDARAMPTITNFFCCQDSWWRTKARNLLSNSFLKIRIYDQSDFRSMADTGIKIVGSNAAPFLVELFRDSPWDSTGFDDRRGRARSALIGIGPDAIPALAAGLTNDNSSIRLNCASAISASSELRHFTQVAPLIACAADANPNLRAAAILALGRILEEPKLSVPALAKGLSDTNSAVRFHAIHSLWAFGVYSKSAIPQIEQAIKREPTLPDAGFDQWELGPKSQAMIMDALTNALETIRMHNETPN